VKLNNDALGSYTIFSNALLKVGTPTPGSGLTYLLFGNCSTNPNVSPLWYQNSSFNQQLRLGINFSNSIGIFDSGVGDTEKQIGAGFTNAGYKVLCLSWSNTSHFAYQNVSNISGASLGINYTLANLNEIGGNFDIVELCVWTNFSMNQTQYFNLYTNYFKAKYPNAGL
jgi:hypothetical protein